MAGFVFAGQPTYTIEQAVALAQAKNPDIEIARKKLEAARGGLIEARAGYLPALLSKGIYRKREEERETRLRSDDYSASLVVAQNLYTGGAVSSQMAIARLKYQQQQLELQQTTDQVTMNVRVAFYELLLNRAKIKVQQQAVDVFREELKTQRERLSAGTVGELNVRRAEVALAEADPDLADAQTKLRLSYLRLAELFGINSRTNPEATSFEIAGDLQYEPRSPDLNECLARALVNRPDIKSHELDIAIEKQQLALDRSALQPQISFFSGYEVYSERDPDLGPEFNHGYVIGINGAWHLFDGHATKGRMIATKARQEAARQALEAIKQAVETEVRSAFLDLQQADRILQSETKNVQTADESLALAKGNLSVGLGTQLDVLQAAADVTRVRTTRLSAIYLHNAALARLARACGGDSTSFGFEQKVSNIADPNRKQAEQQIYDVARPPAALKKQK